MKEGMAMEGFIREDGTVRPSYKYDDTELRTKIQANKDRIDNLDSRVDELEKHGGVEDTTKADKVENATEDNFAALDEHGNLKDSGKKPSDFAEENHYHQMIGENKTSENKGAALIGAWAESNNTPAFITFMMADGAGNETYAEFTPSNINNLARVADSPDSAPKEDSDKLITSGAVYAAIAALAERVAALEAFVSGTGES